jgi:hypothetical protein
MVRFRGGGRTRAGRRERLALILQVGRDAGVLASAFGVRELRRLVRVVGANRRALRVYAPQPFGANLVYLKAGDFSVRRPARRWWGARSGGGEPGGSPARAPGRRA